MPYKRIYSPTGEPFDVPEMRANDLILQSGWTQQPPVSPEPELEEDKPKPRKSRIKREETDEPAGE
jgi:hypothetical protein